MSVPATVKPGRGPRPQADVPGRGPRRVDQTRRRHMILLPQYSHDEACAAEDATRDPQRDGIAARLPIRAVAPTRARAATRSLAAPGPSPARPTGHPLPSTRETHGASPVSSVAAVTPVPRPERAASAHADAAARPRGTDVTAPAGGVESAVSRTARSMSAHAAEALALVVPAAVSAPESSAVRAPRTGTLGGALELTGPDRLEPQDRSRRDTPRTVAAARPGGRAEPRRAWAFARLPRRGQRLLVGAGFALAIGLGALVGNLAGLGHEVPAGTAVVTVEPGESLWQIASATVEPGTDLRPVIDHIRDLNQLDGSTVVDGQRLLVPGSGR